MNYTVNLETANEEFEKICDSWEIDIDKGSMDDDEKIDFKGIKNKIIKAIRLGRLIYNDDGTMTYTVSKNSEKHIGKELLIKRPTGSSLTAMDQFSDQAGMHKAYAVLAHMIKQPLQFLKNLDGLDLKPLLAFSQLFLAD
jgi:hypothetical protein